MSATWHVDVHVLESYATGRSTPVGGASVEAHLMECRECGALLRELMPRRRKVNAFVTSKHIDTLSIEGPC